jgi:hypothetical protein
MKSINIPSTFYPFSNAFGTMAAEKCVKIHWSIFKKTFHDWEKAPHFLLPCPRALINIGRACLNSFFSI